MRENIIEESVADKNASLDNDPEMTPAAIMQEIMYQCETGRALLDASAAMAGSAGMVGMLEAIDDIKNPKYAYTLGKYLGEYMNKDPEKGLAGYVRYIDSIIANPKYSHLKDYHSAVREAAVKMYNSPEYKAFVAANKDFMADDSYDAERVKGYIRELVEQSQEYMDEGAQA